jgi:hypothetical protein
MKEAIDMSNRFFPNYSGYKITSRFGMRTMKGVTKLHKGIDLVAKTKSGSNATDSITAHTGGTVYSVGYGESAGNYIKIKTAPNVIMVYYHLRDRVAFRVGDRIKKGQVIGYMGSTGNSTGAHLHFGIQVDGNWIDPEPYLNKDYSPAVKTVTLELPVLKRGMKCETAGILQAILISYGYSCGDKGADDSFGGDTENALMAYQKDVGLEPDGSCGKATWSKILGV